MTPAKELFAKIEKDKAEGKHKKPCPKCGKPMGPRVDNVPLTIAGVLVCDDCYWGYHSTELESAPLGRRGISRRG